MKRKFPLILGCVLAEIALLVVLYGCSKKKDDNTRTYTYTIYRPSYAPAATVLARINGNPAEHIDSTGKIYIKDQYIYLNEPNKGIFVIDNSNPYKPKQIAFLNIPGNLDMAIKGNILYADLFNNLVALDISDPRHAKVVDTVLNFFFGRYYTYGINPKDSMLVSLNPKDTTVTYIVPGGMNPGGPVFFAAANNSASQSASSSGTGGSMAAMVLMNNYIYAITERHSLGVLDISSATTPKVVNNGYVSGLYDLETIYPFQDKLFLGSQEGVYIFSLNDPAVPTKTGQFSHGRSCDPVVADNTGHAYVTLHAGTSCGGAANELDVLDVKDPMNASLVRTYPLTSPKGLAKDGNTLFVCDGSNGVKVFNAQDPANLKQTEKLETAQAYDVIAGNNHLLVVTKGGLLQYDYSNPNSLKLMSVFHTSPF